MSDNQRGLLLRPELTTAQRAAIKWFHNRGGEGVFTKGQVLLARGELAAVMRSTWNALEQASPPLVTYSAGKGYKRVAITDAGKVVAMNYTGSEADTVEDDW